MAHSALDSALLRLATTSTSSMIILNSTKGPIKTKRRTPVSRRNTGLRKDRTITGSGDAITERSRNRAPLSSQSLLPANLDVTHAAHHIALGDPRFQPNRTSRQIDSANERTGILRIDFFRVLVIAQIRMHDCSLVCGHQEGRLEIEHARFLNREFPVTDALERPARTGAAQVLPCQYRSEEHTPELQS